MIITHYIVELAYRRYRFSTVEDAVKFAEMAASAAMMHTEIAIKFATDEIKVEDDDAVS